MEYPTMSTRPSDANNHQQFTGKAFRTNRLSAAKVAFLAVELSDLNVEFGVMRGEAIHSIEDFHVGDEVHVKDRHQRFAANNQLSRGSQDIRSENHVRLVSELSGCAQKHRVQLMAEHGALVEAFVIRLADESIVEPFMLLPRQFRSADRYYVIDVSEV